LKKILHVGAGHRLPAKAIHPNFPPADWLETRLDLDPDAQPDIVASMLDIGGVDSASMDAVYAAYQLELLYPGEIPVALTEFKRVLKPDGFVFVIARDLQAVVELVEDDELEAIVYLCDGRDVSPTDFIIRGLGAAIGNGKGFMANKTGLNEKTLRSAFFATGFAAVCIEHDAPTCAIAAVAYKTIPAGFVPDIS
jgi:hypothetical protein